jgi:hypothetical protein
MCNPRLIQYAPSFIGVDKPPRLEVFRIFYLAVWGWTRRSPSSRSKGNALEGQPVSQQPENRGRSQGEGESSVVRGLAFDERALDRVQAHEHCSALAEAVKTEERRWEELS